MEGAREIGVTGTLLPSRVLIAVRALEEDLDLVLLLKQAARAAAAGMYLKSISNFFSGPSKPE